LGKIEREEGEVGSGHSCLSIRVDMTIMEQGCVAVNPKGRYGHQGGEATTKSRVLLQGPREIDQR